MELFKELILDNTDERDIVLDTCMGSGTTAVACIDLNRNYIGFELNEQFYKNSLESIKDHMRRLRSK